MTVSKGYWTKYLELLGSINKTARTQFLNFFVTVDYQSPAGRQAVIDFAFALVTKYGEASAEAACQLYDAIAEATGVTVPPAVPAATATIGETAKAINGTIEQSGNADYISGTVERLVKQASTDTIYQNAIRDGAECAWIPNGDTCAFCVMLASNGWRRASKRTLKGNHASHVHANCDCNFAVRFSTDTKYDGYDPSIYRDQYDSAEGDTWQDKLNYMRREQYQLNGDEIRKQKRIAYAMRNAPQIPTISKQIKEFDPMNEYEFWDKSQEDFRLKSIKELTGFDDGKAREILNAFSGSADDYIRVTNSGGYYEPHCWTYGGDSEIRLANSGVAFDKAKLIDEYITHSPRYDAPIYRGMALDDDILKSFVPGAEFVENGNLSSWSSRMEVGQMFADGRAEELGLSPVVLETVNAKYSAPISHLSLFSGDESEVIVSNMHNSRYLVDNVSEVDGVTYVKLILED